MEIVAKQSIQPELPLAQWLLGPWLIQLEKIMANAASIGAIRLGAVITTMAGGTMFIIARATVARRGTLGIPKSGGQTCNQRGKPSRPIFKIRDSNELISGVRLVDRSGPKAN